MRAAPAACGISSDSPRTWSVALPLLLVVPGLRLPEVVTIGRDRTVERRRHLAARRHVEAFAGRRRAVVQLAVLVDVERDLALREDERLLGRCSRRPPRRGSSAARRRSAALVWSFFRNSDVIDDLRRAGVVGRRVVDRDDRAACRPRRSSRTAASTSSSSSSQSTLFAERIGADGDDVRATVVAGALRPSGGGCRLRAMPSRTADGDAAGIDAVASGVDVVIGGGVDRERRRRR